MSETSPEPQGETAAPPVAPQAGSPLLSKLQLPEAITWRDHVIGALLGSGYLAWLLGTARSLGFARDESFYFHAASSYAGWFELLFKAPSQALERGAIDGSWGANHEHPALMKSLFALSWSFLHEKNHVFEDASTAFRFPAMCVSALALWVVYLFAARAYSRRAGVIAALLLACMPHLFYNAHLAAFDAPIMTMWLVSVYVYWRAEQERGLGWALAAGVAYGLTLETKHNAWILPAVFVPHALVVHGRAIARNLRVGRLQIPTTLVAIFTVGPLVFYALWPWIWADTGQRLQEYVNFHMNHEYYNMEFLGRNYFGPPSPRLYVPVLIVASVPTITIFLFFTGLFDRVGGVLLYVADVGARLVRRSWRSTLELRQRRAVETDLLILLALAAPLAVFLRPVTPIFGGTKHWFPAYPFLAILAGRGFDVACEKGRVAVASLARLGEERRALVQRGLPWAMGAAVVAAPLAETVHSHPFGLSAYVPIAGGTAGGADLGLNRQFWGFTTQSLATYFEKAAPRGASVFIHDTTFDAWSRMQEEGRIRRDLHAVSSPGEADFAIVHHELHMNEVDHSIWTTHQKLAPDFVLRHDGVPIISVYKRPR